MKRENLSVSIGQVGSLEDSLAQVGREMDKHVAEHGSPIQAFRVAVLLGDGTVVGAEAEYIGDME